MVVVAQLVRAPDCGSGGRRFETGLPPLNLTTWGFFMSDRFFPHSFPNSSYNDRVSNY